MRSLAVFLILIGFVFLVPNAFGSCISLPCDDSNIKLGEPNYRFIDFSYQNNVGEPIRFVLEKTAYDQCNSYIATITNEKQETIWEQKEPSLCVNENKQNLMTSQIKLGYLVHNPIIIKESGKYLLKVQIDDGSIEREFTARENFSGFSIDRTVYPVPWSNPPLKQFASGFKVNEINCRENLILVQKYDGTPACVRESTKQKLIERGWTSINHTTKDSLENRFSNIPEVVAFYDTYEDAEVLVQDDRVSYFAGGDDGYFVRMNLFFDENYAITDMDFHCYFQRTHQYELPHEDIVSKIAKYDCTEQGKTAGPEPEPQPEPESESDKQLHDAKKSLQNAYQTNVNLGPFYMKDVIVGFGTYDDTLIIDVPLQYTNSIQVIKKEIRHIVGDQVKIDYAIYDEPIERRISTVIPYLWNKVLHQKEIKFTPKEQDYWNNADGFAEHDRVCSPLVAPDGTEFYISSTFDLEPFEITGTFIDKTKPDNCHKIWKTEVIMPEPDRVTALWLQNEN